MPTIPCPTNVTCRDCYDPPILNLSADGPDVAVNLSVGFPGPEPPIGRFGAQGCKTWVWADTQEEADRLAADQAIHCIDDCPEPPCPPTCLTPPCDPPPPPPPQCLVPPCPPVVPPPPPGGLFWNTQRTCTVPCQDGTEFSHTVLANQFSSATSQAEADAFADSYCQQQAHLKQVCFTSEPPNGCKDNSYYWLITASGGVPPYTFALVPGAALPAGLTLYPTGEVSGVPTTTAGFAADISVTDSQGRTNSRIFSFSVAEITTVSPLPDGNVGTPYSETLASSGAPAGALWAVLLGSLPPGIALNSSTGVLSGTPTTNGIYNFTIGLIMP